MRLLIISHMPHHLRDGEVVGWGPTVRELDRLATRFDEVRHIACLHPGPAPKSALPYAVKNLELVPVPPSGAPGFLGKLDVLRTSPQYIRTILRELPHADMVHVRAPAHIALMAMILLSTRKQPVPRWFKYAGNWKPRTPESPSYTVQRWWLTRGWQRGFVTVNGEWSGEPGWIRTFFNPSLDRAEVNRGAELARAKRLTSPIELLYVGRVEQQKGTGRALRILDGLVRRGVSARLVVIGDGPGRDEFEQLAAELDIAKLVEFRGWLPPSEVALAYAHAHVLLLPSSASEGWPKVLSEGMAYGVVPLAGAISSIPQYIEQFRTGAAFPPDDLESFVAAIERYTREPEEWSRESARAVAATHLFTFDHYLESVDQLLADLGVHRTDDIRATGTRPAIS
ncbi:glycosyltransferase [soil metagenome]